MIRIMRGRAGWVLGLVLVVLAWPLPSARAVEDWHGYENRNMVVDGRNALVVLPKEPAAGKPWIWRTEFFGHEPQADIALLGLGFHVAYINVENMYGAPVALDHMDRFYDHLVKEYGLSQKVVLEGFSRGGLFALNWAARHPERVACIYNDAPVCDFRSWPGGKYGGPGSAGDWQNLLKVYGLTEEQAMAPDQPLNPINNLKPLMQAKIPLLHVCGAADEVVPFEENTRVIERDYDGPMTVIAKPGVKHHPHSLVDPTPIVAFVLKYTLGNGPTALMFESPTNYQVHQRDDEGHAEVRVKLVAILDPAKETLEMRAIDPTLADAAQAEWIAMTDWLDPGTNSLRDARFFLKASGWYQLEARVREGETLVAAAAVGHVGVGEVFVIAGQSNAGNHGSEKQTPMSGLVSTFQGGTWRLADDPQPGASGDGGSFIPAFGDALAEKYHVPIGIVALAEGATSVREWLPAGTLMNQQPTTGGHVRPAGDNQWECTGELYNRLAGALNLLGPNGCRAVLWHQGESDAGQARSGYPADRQITGAQYLAFLKTLIEQTRVAVEWDVPWFVAQTTFHSEADPADAEFRAAQKAAWVTGLALEGPDTDALHGDLRDGVHFNGKGLQAHGLAWAEKVSTWLNDIQAGLKKERIGTR